MLRVFLLHAQLSEFVLGELISKLLEKVQPTVKLLYYMYYIAVSVLFRLFTCVCLSLLLFNARRTVYQPLCIFIYYRLLKYKIVMLHITHGQGSKRAQA